MSAGAMTPRQLRRAGRRTVRLAGATVRGYLDDRGPQLAAGTAYFALFAVFPLTILLVAGFGLFVGDGAARREVVDFVMRNVPLRDTGRSDLLATLREVTSNAGAFSVVGMAGLVFSASGLMGALRHALSRAFDIEEQRPPLLGKLVDIALVLSVGLLAGASVALSVAARLSVEVSAWASQVAPFVLATVVFTLLYRFVPARRVRWRQCVPGALLASLGYEAIKRGFAFYLDEFATYGAVYGSIAAVIAFMFFVFLAASAFIAGAELAAAWPRVDGAPDPGGDDRSPRERLRALVRAATGY
ncbi:MAG TPA: YihY/virulence factor BrkB family protein [Solirubrobacteraceae bacterium]|nr:YihY/virulence factor BrkB family protein [Solirubrobacteraceae bacterium]